MLSYDYMLASGRLHSLSRRWRQIHSQKSSGLNVIGFSHIIVNYSGCLVFSESPTANVERPEPVRACTHPWHPWLVRGVVKTKLSSTTSRRLPTVTEMCCTCGCGYDRESIQLRLTHEKEYTGQGPGKVPDGQLQWVLPPAESQTPHFPGLDCDRRHGEHQLGQLRRASVFMIFTQASVCRNGWSPTWPTSISSPSKAWTVWPKPPPSTILLVYLAWLSGQQRHNIPGGLDLLSQSQGQCLDLSLSKAKLFIIQFWTYLLCGQGNKLWFLGPHYQNRTWGS